jgi:hypothetical protein
MKCHAFHIQLDIRLSASKVTLRSASIVRVSHLEVDAVDATDDLLSSNSLRHPAEADVHQAEDVAPGEGRERKEARKGDRVALCPYIMIRKVELSAATAADFTSLLRFMSVVVCHKRKLIFCSRVKSD